MPDNDINSSVGPVKFGTFSGVFIPCFLTIVGVIFYLRLGFVVGQAGLRDAMLMIGLANAITALTALSVAAIATNLEMKAGGAYFLISRSLGPEFGGAIGIAFYLSQAIVAAFYVVGFTEALAQMWPGMPWSREGVALVVVVALFVCAYVGAGWAVKVQYGIFSILVVSVVSFLVGGAFRIDPQLVQENWASRYGAQMSFWAVFAIYFPAVTGIEAGANMSGNLRNPARSLPGGTFLAIGVTALVYLLGATFLAGAAGRDVLLTNPLVMRSSSLVPSLILLGVFAATLSSALTTFVGAPRVLQSLARDRIFPVLNFFAGLSGPQQEPRRAVMMTFVIAVVCVLVGGINVIAPVITMFFLLTYGIMNFAAFFESRANVPSFRPRFRYFHWLPAALGTLACLVTMLLINAWAAGVAIVVFAGLYRYVVRQQVTASWGDAKGGYLFSRIRDQLLTLEEERYHPKNWRPSLLVLTGNPNTRPYLVSIANWLGGQKGLLVLGQVIAGDFEQSLSHKFAQEEMLKRYVEEQRLPAIGKVVVAPEYESGALQLIQGVGLGGLTPNTIMLGWCGASDKYGGYARLLRRIVSLKYDVIVVVPKMDHDVNRVRQIDVWWKREASGNMLILLAYLLSLRHTWQGCRIRVLRVIENEQGRHETEEFLRQLLTRSRVTAGVSVLVSDEPFHDIVRRHSETADIVIMGFDPPEEGHEAAFVSGVESLLVEMPTTLLVKSHSGAEILV